jgi:hypothetical protein
MGTHTNSALPGERWRVKLEPIDQDNASNRQGVVKLVDFDETTKVWSVEPEDKGAPCEVAADNLLERLTVISRAK